MKFIGIDPSLCSTGFVCLNENGELEDSQLIKTVPAQVIEERLIIINRTIQDLLDKYQIRHNDGYKHEALVYIEGLSFMAKGNAILQLAGLHFFLRINLYKRFDLKYEIIAPTSLKKFVTGKGNSKKELMLLEVYKRWGIEFKNNNLADAYGLSRMAMGDRGIG